MKIIIKYFYIVIKMTNRLTLTQSNIVKVSDYVY